MWLKCKFIVCHYFELKLHLLADGNEEKELLYLLFKTKGWIKAFCLPTVFVNSIVNTNLNSTRVQIFLIGNFLREHVCFHSGFSYLWFWHKPTLLGKIFVHFDSTRNYYFNRTLPSYLSSPALTLLGVWYRLSHSNP